MGIYDALMEDQAGGVGTAGVAAAPFLSTPVGAGVLVGSQLLQGYLAQQAQAEQAKRQRAIEIANQHSQGERQGIDQMLSTWRSALR